MVRDASLNTSQITRAVPGIKIMLLMTTYSDKKAGRQKTYILPVFPTPEGCLRSGMHNLWPSIKMYGSVHMQVNIYVMAAAY